MYARVSSAHQAREKTIESQLEALRSYAQQAGHQVEEDLIFIDDVVSGALLERPGLDALREKAALGHIDQVLVLSLDRLARKLAHQFVLIEEFRKLGVKVLCLDHPEDDSPIDRLYRHFLGGIAEYERELILERSRRGKLHKAKQGDLSVMSRAPYGYVYIPKYLAGKADIQIHLQESQVITLIFRLLVEERYSIQAIVRHLNQEKIPPRRSAYWRRSSVFHILKNPIYMGKAAYRKTQAIPRRRVTKRAHDCGFYPKRPNSSHRTRPQDDWIFLDVPAIITREVFEQAQAQLAENKRLSARNTKYSYLLSGLLRCQACGYALHGTNRGKPGTPGHRRWYYQCKGSKANNFPDGCRCSSRSIRSEVLDELVWDHVCQLLLQPDLVLQEYLTRLQEQQQAPHSPQLLLKQTRQSLHNHNSQKERLLDLYQQGILPLTEIQPRLEVLRVTLKELETKCQQLERECQHSFTIRDLTEHFEQFRHQLDANLNALAFIQKQSIIRSIVQDIRVDPHNQQIVIRHTIPVSHKQAALCPESARYPGAQLLPEPQVAYASSEEDIASYRKISQVIAR